MVPDPALPDNWHDWALSTAMEAEDPGAKVKIVRLLLEDGRAWLKQEEPAGGFEHAFLVACSSGDRKLVQLLLNDARTDVAANDQLAVFFAAEEGLADVLEALLTHGGEACCPPSPLSLPFFAQRSQIC